MKFRKLSDFNSVEFSSDTDFVNKFDLRREAIKFIKHLLKNHPEIDFNQIKGIGGVDTGEFQIKVPTEISNLKIVALIAYLKWFYDISSEDLE